MVETAIVGSPKAARENHLEAVLPALAYGLEMLSDAPTDYAKS